MNKDDYDDDKNNNNDGNNNKDSIKINNNITAKTRPSIIILYIFQSWLHPAVSLHLPSSNSSNRASLSSRSVQVSSRYFYHCLPPSQAAYSHHSAITFLCLFSFHRGLLHGKRCFLLISVMVHNNIPLAMRWDLC